MASMWVASCSATAWPARSSMPLAAVLTRSERMAAATALSVIGSLPAASAAMMASGMLRAAGV